jgi:hypothetical protein
MQIGLIEHEGILAGCPGSGDQALSFTNCDSQIFLMFRIVGHPADEYLVANHERARWLSFIWSLHGSFRIAPGAREKVL